MPYADQPSYQPGTWANYSFGELGQWIHLLTKRSRHRSDPEKKAKDLADAQNYLTMMQAKLDALKL